MDDLRRAPATALSVAAGQATCGAPDLAGNVATDPRLAPLAHVCAQTRTAAVVGAPTRDPASGRLHICAPVLGRDGRFAAR